MPAEYVIDSRQKLVRTTLSGKVSTAEVFEHQQRLLADPDFNPTYSQLIDTTLVTDCDVTGESVAAVALRPVFRAPSRRAWVAPLVVSVGMGRMFQTYRQAFGGDEEVRVFHDTTEALAWLSIVPE